MKRLKSHSAHGVWRGLSAVLIMGLAGCAGLALTEIAPPVNPGMLDSTADAEALSRGRKTYLTRCTTCHSAQAVRDYSLKEWERIIPEMCRLAKLSPAQSADIRAYVLAAIKIGKK